MSKRIVSHALRVIPSFVRRIKEISLSTPILLTIILSSCLIRFSHSAELTKYQAEGDCYELANNYLKTRNVAFVISDALKGKSCNWNFQGKTDYDFKEWCKRTGIVCGGNPFYVGYDSVWYDGEFVPHNRALFLDQQKREMKDERRKQDSILNLSIFLN